MNPSPQNPAALTGAQIEAFVEMLSAVVSPTADKAQHRITERLLTDDQLIAQPKMGYEAIAGGAYEDVVFAIEKSASLTKADLSKLIDKEFKRTIRNHYWENTPAYGEFLRAMLQPVPKSGREIDRSLEDKIQPQIEKYTRIMQDVFDITVHPGQQLHCDKREPAVDSQIYDQLGNGNSEAGKKAFGLIMRNARKVLGYKEQAHNPDSYQDVDETDPKRVALNKTFANFAVAECAHILLAGDVKLETARIAEESKKAFFEALNELFPSDQKQQERLYKHIHKRVQNDINQVMNTRSL